MPFEMGMNTDRIEKKNKIKCTTRHACLLSIKIHKQVLSNFESSSNLSNQKKIKYQKHKIKMQR